ncbi:hypothetical protein CNMCM5623_006333 [Aspergillus felis]|uniref:Uncharacterized protein n=1 Tax=Aspergillus felis TaxID=1287682 RepID=A0A8H6V0H0_9EURO|nr:hypothetical protein CNMCM5623_006333 [Aspergillus felis]
MSMLIESDWNDLECVLWHSDTHVLEHWYRDQSDPSQPWYRSTTISTRATGPGCLIQSSPIAPNEHGDFQVVVPEDNNLVHYRRDNSNGSDQTWTLDAIVSNKATGAGSMIQSTYGTPNYPGNFEVVVLEGGNLVHYSHDNSQPNPQWSGPTVIMDTAVGSAALIQSTFGIPNHPGNFEVVVPSHISGSYNNQLQHWYRDNSNMQWHFGEAVLDQEYGLYIHSPSLIQSTYGTPTYPGNFEVIVVDTWANLLHLFKPNNVANSQWYIDANIIPEKGEIANPGPNALIQSNYNQSEGMTGNFEVITVPTDSYQYWHRDNGQAGQPWIPGPTITNAYPPSSRTPVTDLHEDTQRASEAQAKRNFSPLPRTGAVYTPPIALK